MKRQDKMFVIRAIIVCVIVIAVITVIHALDKPKVEAWDYHTVQYGDSLWAIAKEYNPGYEGDLREVMHCIKKANSMEDSTVYVGHVLEVPVMGT